MANPVDKQTHVPAYKMAAAHAWNVTVDQNKESQATIPTYHAPAPSPPHTRPLPPTYAAEASGVAAHDDQSQSGGKDNAHRAVHGGTDGADHTTYGPPSPTCYHKAADTDTLPQHTQYQCAVDCSPRVKDTCTPITDFLQNVGYPTLPEEDITVAHDPHQAGENNMDPNIDEMGHMGGADLPPPASKPPDVYQNATFSSYSNWPFPASQVDHNTAYIYDRVRAAGAPNYKGARIALPSPLNPMAWEQEATGHLHDHWLLDGVQFGFPIQYTGGPCYDKQSNYNHPSAAAYKTHVDDYFTTETREVAMAGPFTSPPVYTLV